MDYFVEDTDVGVNIPFILEGDYFTPDDGSVTYTLRDNSGADVVGQTDIAIATPTGTTSVNQTIVATYNAKDADKYFENRFLEVKGENSGEAFNLSFNYRVMEAIPLVFNYNVIRGFLGVSSSELSNEEIDPHITYFSMLTDYETDFSDAITSGLIAALDMEKALYLKTALESLPSLRLKAAQLESDGLVKFTRFSKMDWEKLRFELQSQLNTALENSGVVSNVEPIFGVFGSGTDNFDE